MRENKVYFELQRGGNDIVRLTRCVFKGAERIDLRCHWRSEAGDVLPTKKGTSIHAEDFPPLLVAMQKLYDELVEDAVLDPLDYETTTPRKAKTQ